MAMIEQDLQISVNGCGGDLGQKMAEAVQAVVIYLVEKFPQLDLRRMHRIIVTADFGGELAALSGLTASKNPITHTNEEDGMAVAQVLILPRACP
jgi:hypothetical protein